ncbi:MAG: hypothetical protein KJ706_02445 [Candidatus Omnitrophica bacterium]|nr:hypothetical protein [Candidatus Omnitrophota bacterium]MBU4589841.1 hypothetical protein [Candidatus Omnitrophota bacterium]
MFKNRILAGILICVLLVSSTGCAGLQRKFTRKKEKEVKAGPVITTYDYAKDLRVEELYKKRFLYWKSWQGELIDRMDEGTYKKRTECYENTVMNLEEMRKYLSLAKVKELDPFIEEIKSIDPDVKKKRLSRSEKYRMGHMLEKTKRRIDKQFSYSKVKDYLELNK